VELLKKISWEKAIFSVLTSGNSAIAQKASLKLSIDILLLFSFANYATEYLEITTNINVQISSFDTV